MYKAVIFDLGKVLVHFDFKRGYRALEGSFLGGCLFSGRQAGRAVAGATGGLAVSRTGAGTARRWCRRRPASPPPCPAPGPRVAPPR